MATKKKTKKRKPSTGLVKYRRAVTGNKSVKAADKAIKKAEATLRKAKSRKTQALKKAKAAWKRKRK